MSKSDLDSSPLIDRPPSPTEEPRGVVSAEPPEESSRLRLRAPDRAAAGVAGVVRSVKHVLRQMPPLKAARALLKVNQKAGFDCVSCAWPESDGDRHVAEFCENGAKAVAWEATSERLTPAVFARYSVAELSRQSDYWLGQQGRITHPMVLRAGASHYEAIAWDDAFALLASTLDGLSSPDEAIFYTSGRTSNEAAFLYQLFARSFGTNNLPDCSNMCHESSGVALDATLGIGKGTVTLDDFDKASVILILGQNPGTNHPRMLTALERAKERGARIIAVNPLPEAGLLRFKNPQTVRGVLLGGTALADLFVQVRINGDLPFLKGVMKELLGAGAAASDFIGRRTAGFDAFADALRHQPWEPLVEQSGVTRAQMSEVAGVLASTDRIIACWAMGLTQHRNAVATIQEVVNLLLLRGAIGKPGAGACPVRGHSNVQGDRTMGISERPSDAFLDSVQRVFQFEVPRRHGHDVVGAIHAMYAGAAKVFVAMGGNFLSASPDTELTKAALQKTRLTVQISTKLNRSHLVTGQQALIFPCLGRTEIDLQREGPQLVSTENSMGVVQMSQGVLEPASPHLLSEPAIVCAIAKRTRGACTSVDWDGLAADYDRIRDLISRTIPGFEDYNARVRRAGGFYLPNGPRVGDFASAPGGKARFTVHALPAETLLPGQLVMMTLRTHDQFNTTIYGLDDRYRGISNNRRVILVNPEDMAELGLVSGDVVDLTSHFNGVLRVANRFTVVPYAIPRRCTATYFPETNVLVPIDSVADESNTPTSKYVVISLKTSPTALPP